MSSCHHEVVSIDAATNRLHQLADVEKKMVVSLPLDEMGL